MVLSGGQSSANPSFLPAKRPSSPAGIPTSSGGGGTTTSSGGGRRNGKETTKSIDEILPPTQEVSMAPKPESLPAGTRTIAGQTFQQFIDPKTGRRFVGGEVQPKNGMSIAPGRTTSGQVTQSFATSSSGIGGTISGSIFERTTGQKIRESARRARDVGIIGRETSVGAFFSNVLQPFNEPRNIRFEQTVRTGEPSELFSRRGTQITQMAAKPETITPGEFLVKRDIESGVRFDLAGLPSNVATQTISREVEREELLASERTLGLQTGGIQSELQGRVDLGELSVLEAESQFQSRTTPLLEQEQKAFSERVLGRVETETTVFRESRRATTRELNLLQPKTGEKIRTVGTIAGVTALSLTSGGGALVLGASVGLGGTQIIEAFSGQRTLTQRASILGTAGLNIAGGSFIGGQALKATGRGGLSLIERESLRDFERGLSKQRLRTTGRELLKTDESSLIFTSGEKVVGSGKQEVQGIFTARRVTTPEKFATTESGRSVLVSPEVSKDIVEGGLQVSRTKFVDPITGRITESRRVTRFGAELTPVKDTDIFRNLGGGLGQQFKEGEFFKGTAAVFRPGERSGITTLPFQGISRQVDNELITAGFGITKGKLQDTFTGRVLSTGRIKLLGDEATGRGFQIIRPSTGKRTPFDFPEVKVDEPFGTVNIFPPASSRPPQIGASPTAPSQGAFTGLGQFERTSEVSFGRAIGAGLDISQRLGAEAVRLSPGLRATSSTIFQRVSLPETGQQLISRQRTVNPIIQSIENRQVFSLQRPSATFQEPVILSGINQNIGSNLVSNQQFISPQQVFRSPQVTLQQKLQPTQPLFQTPRVPFGFDLPGLRPPSFLPKLPKPSLRETGRRAAQGRVSPSRFTPSLTGSVLNLRLSSAPKELSIGGFSPFQLRGIVASRARRVKGRRSRRRN